MHRVSKRLALLACAMAVAACTGQSKTNSEGVNSGQKGQTGLFYVVNVSTPIGGKVTSVDGQLDCGKIGTTVTTACTAQYNWADRATLNAVADTAGGAAFAAWAGDCAGSAGCALDTFDNRADKTVAAVFQGGVAGQPGQVVPVQVNGRIYGYVKNGTAGVSGQKITATFVPPTGFTGTAPGPFVYTTSSTTGKYFLGDTGGLPPGTYALSGTGITTFNVVVPNPTDAACIPTYIDPATNAAKEGPTGCNVRQDIATTSSTPAAVPAPYVGYIGSGGSFVGGAAYNVGFGQNLTLSCAPDDAYVPVGTLTYTWAQSTGPTAVALTGRTPVLTTATIQQVVDHTNAAYACGHLPTTDSYTDASCAPTAACPSGAGKGFDCGVSNFAFEGRPRTLPINSQQATELTYTYKCTIKDSGAPTWSESGTVTVNLAGRVNANYGAGIDASDTITGSNAYAPLGAIVVVEDGPRANHSWAITSTGATVPTPITTENAGAQAWFKLPATAPSNSASYTIYVNNTTTASTSSAAYVKTLSSSVGNIVKAAGTSVVVVNWIAHGFADGDILNVAPASADRITAATPGVFGSGQVKVSVLDVNSFKYDDGISTTTAASWPYAGAGNWSFSDLTIGATIGLRANAWTGAFDPAVPLGIPGTSTTVASGSCGQCHRPNAAGSTVGISPSAPTAPWYAWQGSAHYRIVTDGMAAGDYSTSCIKCHSLGFNPDPNADIGGWNKKATTVGYAFPDFTFLHQGCDVLPLVTQTAADCATLAYGDMPTSMQMVSNVQCESCHGAATRTAHTVPMGARACAYCHDSGTNGKGKHSLYSQWTQSGHANLAGAISEGPGRNTTNQNHCTRCHTAQGYLAYEPQLTSGVPGNLAKPIQGLTQNNVEAITCQTCHDPHDLKLRLEDTGAALTLPSGFPVQGYGAGTLCASCHNSRNGAKDDTHALTSGSGPHDAAQTDVYAGKNAFFMTGVTVAGNVHSRADWFGDTCAECHVIRVPAGFTTLVNHWFDPNRSCEVCHGSGGVNADGQPIKGAAVMQATAFRLSQIIGQARALLNNYNTNVNVLSIKTTSDTAAQNGVVFQLQGLTITKLVPALIHGQMGFNVFVSGMDSVAWPTGYPVVLADFTLTNVPGTRAIAVNGKFAQSMWNYWLLTNDRSEGIHNMPFVDAVLTQTAANIALP